MPAGQPVVTQEPLLRTAGAAHVKQLVAAVPLQVAQEASHPQSPVVVKRDLPAGQVRQAVADVHVAQEALQAEHVLFVVLAKVPAGQAWRHEPLLRKKAVLEQVRQLEAVAPLQVAQDASHPQSPVERRAFPVGQVAQVVAVVHVAQAALQAVQVLLVALAKNPAGHPWTQEPLWRKKTVLEQVRQFVAVVPLQVLQEASQPQRPVVKRTFPVGQVAQVVAFVHVEQEALHAEQLPALT